MVTHTLLHGKGTLAQGTLAHSPDEVPVAIDTEVVPDWLQLHKVIWPGERGR